MRFDPRFLGLLALAACTWETDLPDAAKAIRVDADRSLLVTSPLPSITLDQAIGSRAAPWNSDDYRLLAVVNRTDLSVMPDRAAEGGEGRLVFGHVRERRSIIVEYAQPGPAKAWAAKWQALDGSAGAVASLVGELGPIAQVRTADEDHGAVVLRQYTVTKDAVVPSPLRNEPDYARVTTSELAEYERRESSALEDGTAVMPRAWWATSAVVAPAPPGISSAIANETCTGCHAKTASGFQIDPETGRPTTFLSDPGAPGDELRRRATWMQLALSQ